MNSRLQESGTSDFTVHKVSKRGHQRFYAFVTRYVNTEFLNEWNQPASKWLKFNRFGGFIEILNRSTEAFECLHGGHSMSVPTPYAADGFRDVKGDDQPENRGVAAEYADPLVTETPVSPAGSQQYQGGDKPEGNHSGLGLTQRDDLGESATASYRELGGCEFGPSPQHKSRLVLPSGRLARIVIIRFHDLAYETMTNDIGSRQLHDRYAFDRSAALDRIDQT